MEHTECLAYGAIISFIVSGLKRIKPIKEHPKVTAVILSMIVAGVSVYLGKDSNEVLVIARCVIETFAVSIATHEAVVHPVKENVNL